MTDESGLQFDQAEYASDAGGPSACASCHQPMADQYYLANGVPICGNCQDVVGSMSAGGVDAGRIVGAILVGLAAAAIGTGIYYAVLALTGYEIGLIAIVVGFIVGAAVRWGGGGRGGLMFQILAVFLTYSAICISYLAPHWSQIVDTRRMYKAVAMGEISAVQDFNGAGATSNGAPPAINVPENVQLSASEYATLAGRMYFVSLKVPFMEGAENILGLIIIGIALFEAWKINSPTPINVTGPYDINSLPPPGDSDAVESEPA